jgi:hypothetical protein
MAQVIELACEVAGAFHRYQAVHRQAFRFGTLYAPRAPLAHSGIDYRSLQAELGGLERSLESSRARVLGLGAEDLTQRAAVEVRDALLSYIEALEDAIGKLGAICADLAAEREGEARAAGYRERRLAADKKAYDDAIQHYRRCGIRLNALFETF